MPRENVILILLALVLYALCSGVTMRDRIMVETLHRIERKALSEPPAQMLFEGAVAGMTRQLNLKQGDIYSAYIPPVDQDEYEEGLENRFSGIGIVYRQDPIEKDSEILYPILGSPAFEAGIRSGDRILRVNGKETKELSFGEITELFRGPVDESVEITIVRFGKTEPEKIVIRRDMVLRASVEGDRIDGNGKRIFRLETEPDIAYLRITTFSDRTAQEVRTALEEIAKTSARGLVLDLRDNSGGYVSTCVEIAGFFLESKSDKDVIVSTRYRGGRQKYAYHIQPGTRICSLPMVVLIDGETASASEILSAALQDYQRATIVGERSFGKGVVQEIFPLPMNSGTLQLTDASYWRPSNRNIHRSHDAEDDDIWGVLPDPNGLLEVSELQRYASLQIRDRRSNSYSGETDKLLAKFIDRLPEEIRLYQEEQEDDEFLDDEDENPFQEVDPDEAVSEKPEKTEKSGNKDESEKKKISDEPFVLRGSAPYYDPQLDRAVEILKRP